MNALSPAVEARRRRTFGIISHPDAGNSPLTEALARRAGGSSHRRRRGACSLPVC